MQTTSYSSLQHHTPRSNIIFLASTSYSSLQHHTPRFHIIFLASTLYSSLPHTPSIKLATTPPPPQLPTPSDGTTHNQRAPCGDIPREMEGDAARVPAKTQPWFVIGESFPPKTREEEEEVSRWLGAYTPITPWFFAGCKK